MAFFFGGGGFWLSCCFPPFAPWELQLRSLHAILFIVHKLHEVVTTSKRSQLPGVPCRQDVGKGGLSLRRVVVMTETAKTIKPVTVAFLFCDILF